MADGSLKFDTKIDTEGFKEGTNTLKGLLNRTISALKKTGSSVMDAFSNTGAIDGANARVKALADEIDQYRDSLYYLEKQGLYFGDAEYDKAYQKLSRLEGELNSYKKELSSVDGGQKKATSSAKRFGAELKKTTKASIPLTKSIFKLSNMFKLMVLRMVMRAVIKAVQEGFQNLAQYSKQANKDISALQTSMQTLKNSFATAFAPILTAITPALQTLIGYLSQAITTMGQFFAVLLTGATTFTKAKDAQVDYAKSLAKTAKEANKTLSPIDKLNNVSDSDKGSSGTPNPGEMFETVKINPAIASVASAVASGIKASFEAMLNWFTNTFGPTFASIWTGLQPVIDEFKTIVSGAFADIQTLWQPFLDYITGSFTPFLQQAFATLGEVAIGLFDTFNTAFSDIWNLVLFPIIEKFVTVILPMFTNFGTKVIETFGVLFQEVKKLFDMIWSDAIAPALEIATKIWTDFVDIMKEFWDKWGKPIFDGIKKAIQTTSDLFVSLWKKFLKPIWDKIMEVVDKLWTKHLKPLLANIMDFVGELVTAATDIYNGFIAPVVKWFVEKLGPPISKVINFLIDSVGDFLGGVIDVASSIIDALKGLVNFIAGVFTGDWERAWNGIKDFFKGIWDALVGIVKTPINLIIDLINGLVGGIVSGVNTAIKAINSISFTVPDWVPGVGGKGIGFNIRTITAPKIPRLATGTVVPANYGEFMTILGDNKREAEVVSPLSTMKQAFKEALAETGGTGGKGMAHYTIQIGKKVIFEGVVEEDKEYIKETGKSAFAY